MEENFERSALALLFPDKIIIETTNKKDAGTSYCAGLNTVLFLDVSDKELGEIVMNHLSQSKYEEISYDQIKKNWKLLIKKSKYRTEKAFFQNAKYLSIKSNKGKIEFAPFQSNVSRRMFSRIPAGILELSHIPETSDIGKEIRRIWGRCLIVE